MFGCFKHLFSPRDVVIDLVGYRKFGHNEIDEPMFTQPIMYSIIKKHKNILDLYSEKLISDGVVTKEETKAVVDKYDKICEEAYKKAQEATVTMHKHWLDSPWSGFFEGKDPLKMGDVCCAALPFYGVFGCQRGSDDWCKC